MRCKKHNRDGAYKCAHCGNILCEDCDKIKVNGKIACCKECRNRIVRADTIKFMGIDVPEKKK